MFPHRFQERENLNSARGVRLRAQAANIGSTVKKESGHIVKTIKQKVGLAVIPQDMTGKCIWFFLALNALKEICVRNLWKPSYFSCRLP